MKLSRSFVTVTALAMVGIACTGTSSNGNGGTTSGGVPAAGGTPSTGGAAGSGGSAVGGSGGAGGSAAGGTASGGTSSGGTTSSSGGISNSGGTASGGAASGGSASGGATGRGGASTGGVANGGTSGKGGGTGSGGMTAAGGAGRGGGTGTGGAATGGASANGGSTGTGGNPGGLDTCPSLPGAPAGTPPLPSPAQIAYQRTEMTSFIHYGLATYDGQEQCNPADSPSIFNPSKLDATSIGQWVTALKGAGFRQSMLVTKHSCGFALWPSKYTEYSVKSSPWKGDVVQLWTDAMDANDMRVALYLSPWDSKYPSSSSTYETYFKNQLTELFAYGPAYEIEFDGFNAPTNVNWKSVFQFIKQAQPNILIWAGPEIVRTGANPDLQWIGNENGMGSRTVSSVDTSNCGGGNYWCPWECNTSSHRPQWFWHPNPGIMSAADMQKVYFQTVGMNCTLNFNVPPSQTGEFDPKDLSLLQSFGTWYASLYKTNLAKGAPATADSTWATAGFEAAKAVDDDICTYWAGASGKTAGRLEVTLASPTSAKLISIREAIELGERVKKYHVEIKTNGNWNTAPTDSAGTKLQGTVIGNRQLWQLNATNIEAVALVIDSAKDTPAIAELGVY
jgi:alpha-L-fucosidase